MNRYRISYETYIEVEAKDEDSAEMKAGETDMDAWMFGDTEIVEVEDGS